MAAGIRTHKGRSLLDPTDSYCAVDIETTGTSCYDSEIIEIGAVRVVRGQMAGTFASLVHPRSRIPRFITDLTGITNTMVKNAPSLQEVMAGFRSFLGNDIILGHNVNFDVNFLYDASAQLSMPPLSNDFVDTLRLSRKIFPDLPEHKLSYLRFHFGIATPPAHRAESDCIAAIRYFEIMRSHAASLGMTPEQLYQSRMKTARRR